MSVPKKDSGSKRTLSASQFRNFYSCNRKWAYQKVEDIPTPPNVNMEKGTFVHRVVELFNKQRDPLSLYKNEFHSMTSNKFYKVLESQIFSLAKKQFKNSSFNGFEDEIKSKEHSNYIKECLRNYVKTIVWEYERLKESDYFWKGETKAFENSFPDKNEHSIVVEDEEGDWVSTSTIDAVFEKSSLFCQNTAIIDYKSSSKQDTGFPEISNGYDLQLKFYAWLFWQAHGVVPDIAGIHYLRSEPDDGYPIVLQDIGFYDIVNTHNMIKDMWENSVSEDIDDYQRNEQYQWCGEDYCEHWDYCLGDKDGPGDIEEMEWDGPDREKHKCVLSEPDINNLEYASNSNGVFT